MFKLTKISQGDLFKNISTQLSGRKQKILDSEHSWHNVFYHEVLSKIGESLYSVLYHKNMGRPNASIRILLGMMILKEGNGWSDEQLFEECRFNLKVMRALGLFNIDDDVPSESTYYEFRKLLGDYYQSAGRDLIKESFINITTQQIMRHGVSGKKIRMDSKLINSNIVRSNRLHLIVEAVRKYVRELSLASIKDHFDDTSYALLEGLQQKSTSNITYPLKAEEKRQMLVSMGGLIQILLEVFKGSESANYKILKRIYEEQYEQIKDIDDEDGTQISKEILPKSPKDISSASVQSIHDPQAAYRAKGQGASKQTVTGYHSNITETCDPEDCVNLITDVELAPANVSEDAFLVKAVDASQKIIKQANKEEEGIEEVISDGGYDSIDNREEMLKEENPNWSISKMKGRSRVYQMEYDQEGTLKVYDVKSSEPCEVEYSERAQKYVIKSPNGGKRYMTPKQVENYIQHQQVENQANKESYNLRASAESTIHQMFHRLKKGNKIVYRGLIKCQWYAISRAFWVNIIRITDKKVEECLIFLFSAIQRFVMVHIIGIYVKMHKQS